MGEEWAVITGAANGIGRALADQLLHQGYHILAIDKDNDALETLSQAHPETVRVFTVDLSELNEAHLKQLDALLPGSAGVKFLVHNAAETSASVFGAISRKLCDLHFSVNVIAPLLLTQALASRLEKVAGRVMNISTNMAHRAPPGQALYALSKGCLDDSVAQLRCALRCRGVLVTTAIPGMTDTACFWRGYEEARSLALPLYDRIRQAIEAGNPPHSPHLAAKFLAFVLTATDDHEYEEKSWTIYDETLTARWKA